MNKKVITYADNISNNGLREYHNLKELKKGALHYVRSEKFNKAI